MRLRKIKNAQEKLAKLNHIVIFNPENYKGKWNELFQNDNPIYIEIGMGKGKFLLEHALKNPNINYIGIEVADSVLLKAAQKIDNYQIKNLYLMNIDAANLENYFNKNEVTKIYLNFSDPWPKTRHAKRRLTYRNFLNLYKSILVESGEIEFKTDNRGLFEFSVIELNNEGFEFLDLSFDLHKQVDLENPIITTEYEDKFKSLGQVIYYIKVKVK